MATNAHTLTLDAPAIQSLQSFHASHFPTQPVPSITPQSSTLATQDFNDTATQDVNDVATTSEDAPSFYPDGTHRTLTDEQIAMFRHSEIQRLLLVRDQRREREEKERKRDVRRREREARGAARGQRFSGEVGGGSELQVGGLVEMLAYDDETHDTPVAGTIPEGKKKFLWPMLGARQ
jgi:hypothetical protein